jgi:hypothetical protein
MIEAVGKATQVSIAVLGELEMLVGSLDLRFQVAQDRVDPLELFQFTGFAMANYHEGVRTTGVDDPSEAAQSVAQHIAARLQAATNGTLLADPRPVVPGLSPPR